VTERERRIAAVREIARDMSKKDHAIVRRWLRKGSVRRVLEKHGFSLEAFETIALEIVHYFVGAPAGREAVGNCVAIRRFIDMALERGLESQEVMTVCMGLERALYLTAIGREGSFAEAGWLFELLGEIYERSLVAALAYFDERRLARESEKVRQRSLEVHLNHLQAILGELESAIVEIEGERPVYANAAFLRLAAVPDLKTFMTHHPNIWDIFESVSRYEELFVDFVNGLKDLLVSGDIRAVDRREISLEEPDPADLIVSLGREVLLYFNTDRFVPSRFEVASATPTQLTGWLYGEPFDPDRMAFRLEVKGVTYHDLKVRKLKGKWQVRVTFDV